MVKNFFKHVIRILLFLCIFFLAGICIYFGIYFTKLSKKSYAYGVLIDQVFEKIDGYFQIDSKYFLGDNFTISGTVDFNLSSEDYEQRSLVDEDYLKKKNELDHLSQLDISYTMKQDCKNKVLFLSLERLLGEEDVYSSKYLVEDSTKYYLVQSIVDNYVNIGGSNYFEMFHNNTTTQDNINYLYKQVWNSLKKQIKEEDLNRYDVEINLGDDRVAVKQISYKITDKVIKKVLKGILKDLKKDKKSNLILTGIDSDFFERDYFKDKEFLSSNESYTIHIYTSKFLVTPLKYELVYMKDDYKEVYSYEGNLEKGLFYYSVNDQFKYRANVFMREKKIDIVLSDQKDEVGSIKLEKDINNLMLTITLNLDDKKYDFTYSTKYKDFVQNKSYTREDTIAFKVLDQMVTMMNGDIKIVSNVSSSVKISEDISSSILKSTLSDEDKQRLENVAQSVSDRLQRS